MKKKKTRFLFENIGGNGFKLVKELGIGPKPPPGDEFETWGSKNKDLMVVYQ